MCILTMYADIKTPYRHARIEKVICEFRGEKYELYTEDCESTGGSRETYDGYLTHTYFGLHTIDPDTGNKNYEFPDGFADPFFAADIVDLVVSDMDDDDRILDEEEYDIECCWFEELSDNEEDDE